MKLYYYASGFDASMALLEKICTEVKEKPKASFLLASGARCELRTNIAKLANATRYDTNNPSSLLTRHKCVGILTDIKI